VVALVGCAPNSTETPAASAPPAPVGYREAVIAEVKATFFDPYSIRDATISRPLYAVAIYNGGNVVPISAWIVCVKANAKNRMGGYGGQEFTAMVFAGNTITTTLSGPSFQGQVNQHCKPARMEPFPEIEMTG